MVTVFFVIFGGLALGCAVSLVAQRNPLYSAVSLVGVFISLAGLYILLAAPFIAAVQVIVYAGAIMVLVVFVIMLLNVDEEERRLPNWKFISGAVILGAILFGEAAFLLTLGNPRPAQAGATASDVGLTSSIGRGLFTEYLLPFEITSVLILMAIVGAMTLARRNNIVAFPRAAQTSGGAASAGGETYVAGGLRPAGGGLITPGDTEATGQSIAEAQIERSEAGSPSTKGEEG